MACSKRERESKLYKSLTNQYGKKKGESIYRMLLAKRKNRQKNKKKKK